MKLTIFALILFLTGLNLFGQTAPVAAQLPVEEATRIRLQTFDQVWNTVNEKHYDPTFGGVDWNKVRSTYSPKAAAAKTDDELNAVLRQMLNELKLSHFGIFPKDLETRAAGAAGIGVELKMVEGEPVVWRVDAGSTADAAGLKPGYVVRKINDTAVSELLKPLEASMEERHLSEALRKIYRERTLEAFMSGSPETQAVVDVALEGGKILTIRATRKPFTGELSQPIGNFPGQRVAFESKRVNGNTGYVRFNMWVIPQLAKLRAAVREFSDTKAIIFDLRGNPGGLGGMASGVAGLVMDKQSTLGSMHSRGGSVNFVVYPQENPFLGKVVILTDYGTGSTSEVFAAGMQENGRATIIGETSAGAVLPSVFEKLPTGAIFQYAISDYRSPKNILIEGRGVKPDIPVSITRDALLAGRDEQLEAAIAFISK
jgi:carboxyl-terminal processing protease